MKKRIFYVPVSITFTGTIAVKAEDASQAKIQAEKFKVNAESLETSAPGINLFWDLEKPKVKRYRPSTVGNSRTARAARKELQTWDPD